MGTFTFVTPPEVIEEEQVPPEEKGACFKVTVNDEPCFSVSPFQKECFFIKGDEEYDDEIENPPPELIDLTDLGILYIYCMHFTSVDSLYMLVDMEVDNDDDYPVHTFLISASYTSNASGGVQTVDGITSSLDMEYTLGETTFKPRNTPLARIYGHNNINTGVMALYMLSVNESTYRIYLFHDVGGLEITYTSEEANDVGLGFFVGDNKLAVGTHVNGITSCPEAEPEDQHSKVYFKVMDKYGVVTNSDIGSNACADLYYEVPISLYYEDIFTGEPMSMGNIGTGIQYQFRLNFGGGFYEYLDTTTNTERCYYGHVGEIRKQGVAESTTMSSYDGIYIGNRSNANELRFRRADTGEIVSTLTLDETGDDYSHTIASGYVLTVTNDNTIKQTAIYSIID